MDIQYKTMSDENNLCEIMDEEKSKFADTKENSSNLKKDKSKKFLKYCKQNSETNFPNKTLQNYNESNNLGK